MMKLKTSAEIGILIYPGCQLAAVHGLSDLFRIANEWVTPVDADHPRQIGVSHWQVNETSGEVERVWSNHPEAGRKLTHLIAPPSIIMPERMQPMDYSARWMTARHAEGVVLCSVCAGAFVLAETGLLEGRRATTHWAFAETLAAKFPKVQLAAEHMVIDDGDIVTAGGILAWTDLGLTLVGKICGLGTMLATARFLLVDPPRREQQVFAAFLPKFDHGDAEVLRAQHHIHAQPAAAHTISDLAARSGLGERTFLRRFTKATRLRPTEYLQQVRIMKSRDLLELSNQPVEGIAWSVGYSDASAFRKVFQKITGVSPNLYRQRFSVV